MKSRIIILYGDNSFEKLRELSKLKKDFENKGFTIENINSENIEEDQFISIISGASLFSEKKFIIAKDISLNNNIWSKIVPLLDRLSTDNYICIIEDSFDKRSKIYKELSNVATFKEFKSLSKKDHNNVIELARILAKNNGISLDMQTAKTLIDWVGYDEWKIKEAIEKLSLLGDINEENIKHFIPPSLESNTFNLLELTLKRDIHNLLSNINIIKNIEGNEGAYKLLGLLSTQFFQIISLKIGLDNNLSIKKIAKDIEANEWALNKIKPLIQYIDSNNTDFIIEKISQADKLIKRTSNPWDIIVATLSSIATINLEIQ
ncbi:DNA polymerase III subunit delta [Candidatus Nanogingivalis gingivitcus]|jgi:DNA polymerase III, delta subunit|uniref:DNA-directed DNA polymerase n=1 Tax=Candidatus Nanogingivalis gingivitcus TaxID=2171992 RepID=A0ABY0FHX2_9BACT|nr:DNA polymerase III subunit delta [Candidatus Nanogingivalis gingivitcus]RYC72565.1 hypothetical protein G6CMJM_00367 [Candidatus Nanogingivalis gingivitcus]